MGSTNVKIVFGSHSIAWDVAGVNIVTILSTGSVNGMVSSSSKVVWLMWDLFEGDEPEDQLEPEDLPSVSGPEFQPKENTMVIINKSGVHRLEQAPVNDLQHVFSPCSGNYISPSSKGHYIDKALGKDQYRELMRVTRQWRQLKTMKWHGFSHRSNAPNAGDLALFCPTCPQPGINICLSGNETLDDWKYTRSFVMDGNFSCKYKQAKNCITESEKAFDRLDEAAPANLKTEWLANERIAQSSRINDPAVMDVYEINIKKAPSKKEIELRLLEQGNARNAAPSWRSVATWISMGLAIEEAQIVLLIEVQRIRKQTMETQRLDLAQQ
ncbi:uncharacterized protein EDB93DRAFT_1248296 [Suillus bovinus]|uniref:uncharacterized protein n=1 Tax=Suillus bovinus TaxID=48563 RepID=UPI001B8732E0|nr:uncharacterized protein EDB93DRAFT_1248296 [Suillus bovinus]KAG2154495.1 hypothetical protein EDB93DRAFT_1248296 [Suillus bovinus]